MISNHGLIVKAGVYFTILFCYDIYSSQENRVHFVGGLPVFLEEHFASILSPPSCTVSLLNSDGCVCTISLIAPSQRD